MTKKKGAKEARYACNGCGFETAVIGKPGEACPGCGHNTEPVYRKLETDTGEGEDTP